MQISELYSLLYDYIENSSIDSRLCEKDSVFFALKGEKVDGHDFLEQAFDNGAKYAIVDKKIYNINKNCIVVDNVFNVLVELAKYKRRQINIPILAITGSAGKTTTKELCREVLSKKLNVFATYRSFNSKITVPLSILQIPPKCDIAILEIGASAINHIKKHCEIILPTYGIITSIRPVHIEGFGSFEKIIQGKTELYDFLGNNSGVSFVNYEDALLLSESSKRANMQKNFYQKDVGNSCSLVFNDEMFLSFSNPSGEVVKTHFFGNFNLENISAAYSVGKFFRVNDKDICDAISGYVPKNNRSEFITTEKNNKIILDAYNANIVSLIECAKLFSSLKLDNKILILGAMRELGNKNEEMHRQLGQELLNLDVDQIYLIGSDMQFAKEGCCKAVHFFEKSDFLRYLSEKKFKNHNFFIKGARYWQLEDLVSLL